MSKHLKFFGLERAPFEGKLADSLLLETGPLRRAVSWIRDAFQEGTTIVALTGSRGVGKTSVARALPHVLGGRFACLLDASLGWEDVQISIAEQLGLPVGELGRSALLERRFSESGQLVVAIDNAEQLVPESCTALRGVIANANEPGGALLHCVLLANPERGMAGTPAAEWVHAARPRIELAPMIAREVKRYIEARLKHAGWDGGDLFTADGLEVIHRLSGGNPRTANRICEQALVHAAGKRQRSISGELVESLGVRPRPAPNAGAEATEPVLRTPKSRRRPEAQSEDLPARRPAAAEGGSVAGERQPARAANTNAEPDGALPAAHRDIQQSVSEADSEQRTRPSLPVAARALARRVPSSSKLPAALVGGVAAALLISQVVTQFGGEERGATASEPRARATQPPPRESFQASPALTQVYALADDPSGAQPEPIYTCSEAIADPMLVSQEVDPAEDPSGDGTEAALGAPTDAAETTAATEATPKPATVTAASRPTSWLERLEVSLDAPPAGPATRPPILAIPEPDLARRLSPADASATK